MAEYLIPGCGIFKDNKDEIEFIIPGVGLVGGFVFEARPASTVEFDIDGALEVDEGVEWDVGGVVERGTEAAEEGGKVTLNTRSHPLGVRAGMGFGMGG